MYEKEHVKFSPNIYEIRQKEERIRKYMEQKGVQTLVIGRQDNFAWFTGGGDNRVCTTTEMGAAFIVITHEKKYIIGYNMDAPRVYDDEVVGQGYELVSVIRGEKDLLAAIKEVVGNRKAASDVLLYGFDFVGGEIYNLHYPFLEDEMIRYRHVGKIAGKIIEKVAYSIEPGQTEIQIASNLLKEFADYGFTTDILLVGSDERINKYRHPNPSYKKVEKSILLAPVAKKWGLRAIQSRMIHFGEVPKEIKKKQYAVSMIQAHMIANAIPGRRMSELLKMQKELFKQSGYENEWKLHWQGSCTGYQIGDLKMLEDNSAVVGKNMAFAWFTTITGAKSEETSLVTDSSQEVITNSKNWPKHRFDINGKEINIPDILEF